MRILSLILSLTVFAVAGYFFVVDFEATTELNYLIYMSLLVILMMICVVGVLINYPMIIRQSRKTRQLMYNSYSEKRTPNKAFDRQFEIV